MRTKLFAALVFVVSAALIVFVAGYRPSSSLAQTPPLTYGTLDNFDVINDTGGPTHGFEIELEGISSADVAYTFGAPYQRYGDPTIVPTATGVIIRYAALYDITTGTWKSGVPDAPGFTPIAVAPFLPTQGHSCWTGGVATPNDYYSAGCDHFGVSLNATPTKTTYRWLIESPSAPGTLVAFGSNAPLPAPVWNVTPAATPGAQPVAAVAIAPPAPDAYDFGDAMWVKVFVTELPDGLQADDLEHMVIDDPNADIVPNEPAEVEIEWVLLQSEKGKPGEQEFGGAAEVGEGNEAVSRRFEFYKYVGEYDPESHEALCDNSTICPEAIGDIIGAQNVAVNLVGEFGAGPVTTAVDDGVVTNEDLPLTIGPDTLLGNDVHSAANIIAVTTVQNAVNGTVGFSGNDILFTPDANFNGTASFDYTMADGHGTSSTATVTVTVNAVNDAPMANAGPDQAARTRNVVILNGAGSSDVDGNALTYSWLILSAPAHSKAALSSGSVVNPSFKADKAGTYEIQLIVNDGTVDSVADTVIVTVTKGKK